MIQLAFFLWVSLSGPSSAWSQDTAKPTSAQPKPPKVTPLKVPELMGTTYHSFVMKMGQSSKAEFDSAYGNPEGHAYDRKLEASSGEASSNEAAAGGLDDWTVYIRHTFYKIGEISDGDWQGSSLVLIEERGVPSEEGAEPHYPPYTNLRTGVVLNQKKADEYMHREGIANGSRGKYFALVGSTPPKHKDLKDDVFFSKALYALGFSEVGERELSDEIKNLSYLKVPEEKIVIGGFTLERADEFIRKARSVLEEKGGEELRISDPLLGRPRLYQNIYSFSYAPWYFIDYVYAPPEGLPEYVWAQGGPGKNFDCSRYTKRGLGPYLENLDFVTADKMEMTPFKSGPKFGDLFTAKDGGKASLEMYKKYSDAADYHFEAKARGESGGSENVYGDKPIPQILEKKLSEKELNKLVPAVYWLSPTGKYLRCTNVLLMPPTMAEPVLYLYPPKTSTVEVSLDQRVRIQDAVPVARNNSWTVRADANGQLVDIESGKPLPYIFWEGQSAYFPQPTKWFYVKREDLPSFLSEKLAKLGLSAREMADFQAFWLPRMRSSALYKVYFHTDFMNYAAPYNISPQPDALIRVMMEYHPVNTAGAAAEPELPPTPERKGFTAVEWGGLILP